MNQFITLEEVDRILVALYDTAASDRERSLIRAIGQLYEVLALATERTASPPERNAERQRRGDLGMTAGGPYRKFRGEVGVIPLATR